MTHRVNGSCICHGLHSSFRSVNLELSRYFRVGVRVGMKANVRVRIMVLK